MLPRLNSPGLVIVGNQANDDDSNQTRQLISTILGWAQAAFASKVEIGSGSARVTREVDGGLQIFVSKRPKHWLFKGRNKENTRMFYADAKASINQLVGLFQH